MEIHTVALALVAAMYCCGRTATTANVHNNNNIKWPLFSDGLGFIVEQRALGRSIMDGFYSFMTNGYSDLLYTLADNPLKGFPGLDPDECVKRSICEAHNHPDAYGWLAVPFQLFFPPYGGNQLDDDSLYFSKYQLAARYGKSDNADCGREYWGCMFNPLSVIQRIIRWFF